MRRALALLAVVAALGAVHCSKDVGTLRLGLYVGDLLIPDDTNLMGLYIAELRDDGAVITTHAYEATPLRTASEVKVPFPASLVLVSGDVTTRLHAKLVAFHVGADGTRTALTMRESRTQVPSDDAKLLRLSLFWTGVGNVVDDRPGAAVQSTVEDFGRLHSLCDGAPAADGQTAGEDGHCTVLDVVAENDVIDQSLPGSAKEDPCFDVPAAFASVTVVDRTSRQDLGDRCSFQVPQALATQTFNVGLRIGTLIRPLPLDIGAVRAGDRVSVRDAACKALATDAELVLALGADPWRGAIGTCSPWNTATSATVNGSPTPAPDAGPPDVRLDSSLPLADASDARDASDASDAAASTGEAFMTLTNAADVELYGLAAEDDVIALTGTDGTEAWATRLQAFQASTTELTHAPAAANYPLRPRTLQVGGVTEFYVESHPPYYQPAQFYYLNPASNTLDAMGAADKNIRAAQVGVQAGVLYTTPVVGRAILPANPADISTTDILLQGGLYHNLDATLTVGNRLLASWFDSSMNFGVSDCVVEGTAIASCVDLPLHPTTATAGGTIDGLVHTGFGDYAVLNDQANDSWLVQIPAVAPYDGSGLAITDGRIVNQLVGGPDRVCWVDPVPDAMEVLCLDGAGTIAHAIESTMTQVVVASDSTSFYAAYTCAGVGPAGKDVHLYKAPWSHLATGARGPGCSGP